MRGGLVLRSFSWMRSLLFVIFLFLLPACDSAATAVVHEAVPTLSQTGIPSSGNTQVPVFFPTPETRPTGQLIDVLISAEETQLKQPAFRTIAKFTANGANTTVITEYQAPDRIRILQNGHEFILINGKGTWEKVNGQWTQAAQDLSITAFSFLDPAALQQLRESIINSQTLTVGPDYLDGKAMWVYQYTINTEQDGKLVNGSTKIWISAQNNLPYRSESVQQSPSNPGSQSKTILEYQYDTNINIPIPNP